MRLSFLVTSYTCLPLIISKPIARPKGLIVLWTMYFARSQLPRNGENISHSRILLSTTVFTLVRVKHHFMLKDCGILGRQSRLCAA